MILLTAPNYLLKRDTEGGIAASFTLPIAFDTDIQQDAGGAGADTDYHTNTKVQWGQDTVPNLGGRRGILISATFASAGIPAVGQILTATLHSFPYTGLNGTGAGTTEFKRCIFEDVTDRSTWTNRRSGAGVATAWQAGGGGTDFTATNAVTGFAYPALNAVTVPGFAGMMNDARAAGHAKLVTRVKSESEASNLSSRYMASVDNDIGQQIAFYDVSMNTVPGVPTNISPPDGTTGVNACGVQLIWNAASGATGYNVYLDTVNPPVTLVSPNQPQTAYTTLNLTPSTQYFWRIGAVNASGETLGAVWSFTTETALGAVTNPTPVDTGTGIAVSPTFSATAGAHATYHNFYIYKHGDPVPTTPSIVHVAIGGFTIGAALQYSTQYDWFIISYSACRSIQSSTFTFTTTTAPANVPGAPTNPSPGAAGTCTLGVPITTANLTWTNGANTTSVTVEIASAASTGSLNPGPDLNDIGIAYTGAVITSLAMPWTLVANTTYYWRVIDANASGATYGPWWCFTTAEDQTSHGTDASSYIRNRKRPFKRCLDGFNQSAPCK